MAQQEASKSDWAAQLILPARREAFERTRPSLLELAQDSSLGQITFGNEPGEAIDPPIVKSEANELIRLLPKLKTHLLEQEAKYAFMHFLIGEDAPDDDDMTQLLAQIPPKKEALRTAKKKLTDDEAALIGQAKSTNDKHLLLKAEASQNARRDAQIVEAKVSFARLRQQHPHSSRMTASRAEELAEEQDAEMIRLQEEIDDGKTEQKSLADRVAQLEKRVAQTTAKRAELERELKARKLERQEAGRGEDTRINELTEWYTAYTTLHETLSSVNMTSRLNTLVGLKFNSGVTLGLNFDDVDNPRILIDAEIDGVRGDTVAAVRDCVARNDTHALVQLVGKAATTDRRV